MHPPTFISHLPTQTRLSALARSHPLQQRRSRCLPDTSFSTPPRRRPLCTASSSRPPAEPPSTPPSEPPSAVFSTAASYAPTLSSALTEAVSRALANLSPGGPPDLALIFVSVRYSLSKRGPSGRDSLDLVVPRLRALVPQLKVVLGCTTDGVIGNGPTSDVIELQNALAVSITLARLPNITMRPFHVMPDDLPALDARQTQWRKLVCNPDDANNNPAFIVLSDPSFSERGELATFLAGLDFAYPGSCVVGSMASAAAAFAKGHMFCTLPRDVLASDSSSLRDSGLVGIALTGDIEIDCLVSPGCRPIGPVFEVRKVHGGLIEEIEIAERPSTLLSAASHLKGIISFATPQEKFLIQDKLHVGVAIEKAAIDNSDDYLIRHVINVDMEGGGIAIAHDIRSGQHIRFFIQEPESAEDVLDANMQRYKRVELANSLVGYSNPPFGALVFVDANRGAALFREPRTETRNLASFATGVPVAGCFSGGQIGPTRTGSGGPNTPSIIHHAANVIAFVRNKSGISPSEQVDSPSTSAADIEEEPEK